MAARRLERESEARNTCKSRFPGWGFPVAGVGSAAVGIDRPETVQRMNDEQQPQPQPKRSSPRRKGLQIDAPGFEAEVSEDTAQTFLDYTGGAWVWVVLSLALSIVVLAVCLGLSWLI